MLKTNLKPEQNMKSEIETRAIMNMRKQITRLEKEATRSHRAMREMIEQIAFHRETLGKSQREIFRGRIRNFEKRMLAYCEEYQHILRDPVISQPLFES